MRKRVAVVGATGYSGSELCSILIRHASVEIVGVYSSSEAPARPRAFSSIHPSLGRHTGPDVVPFSLEALAASRPDTVFLATPNEVSAKIAQPILDTGATVIDLSGAFRLRNPADYPLWYGFDHPSPALLGEAVYGLPEFCNGELKTARLIANPGCYPTSVLLALKPLVPFLDRKEAIVCDSMSGVSGAGKKSELAYSFSELAGNCKAYGVDRHRHTPEMLQNLPLATYTPFVFTPHLLPTVRGILSTIHVGFLNPHTAEQIHDAYVAAYKTSPVVSVREPGDLPSLNDVVGTPRADIGFQLLYGGKRAVVVCAIDNLLKGAASQAVQNFNRNSGFAESEGLA